MTEVRAHPRRGTRGVRRHARNPPVSRLMAHLRHERGDVCEVCEGPAVPEDPLEFAHLERTGLYGRGRGGRERYYDIRDNPESYALMHRTEHREFDRLGLGPAEG